MYEQIISVGTAISTIAVKLVGYPSQIRKILISRSVANLSVTHFTISFVTYLLWTLHGINQQDWVVIVGQGLGIVTSGILMGLILVVRRGKKAGLPKRLEYRVLLSIDDGQAIETGEPHRPGKAMFVTQEPMPNSVARRKAALLRKHGFVAVLVRDDETASGKQSGVQFPSTDERNGEYSSQPSSAR